MFPNTTTLHSSHQFLWKIFGAQYIPNFCAPRCSFLCGNGAAKLVYDLKRFIFFAPSAMEGSIFFFPRSFFNRRSLRVLDCFTGQSPGSERSKWAISIPVAPALQRRRPSPNRSSLTRGGEAAGLGGWGWGFGQELAPKRIIPLNTGKMGAVLVEEAGGKGLQGSMGQQGRPSVDEGRCHRVLEKAGCLSGFRVCEELDKTGGFFASIFLLFRCQGRRVDIVGCA